MRDEHELDRLLDEALAGYTVVEPPPSLAERIISRAQQAPARPRWMAVLVGTAAVSGCVVAVIAALLLVPSPRVLRLPMEAAAPPAPRLTEPIREQAAKLVPTQGAAPEPTGRARRRHAARPYQPAPLSEQERLLVRFVTEHPEEARKLLAPPPSGPIRITPLRIAPIEIANIHMMQAQQDAKVIDSSNLDAQ